MPAGRGVAMAEKSRWIFARKNGPEKTEIATVEAPKGVLRSLCCPKADTTLRLTTNLRL